MKVKVKVKSQVKGSATYRHTLSPSASKPVRS